MDTLFKVVAVGVVGSLLVVTVKRGTPEIGLALGLFITCGIVVLGFNIFSEVLGFMADTATLTKLSGDFIAPLFKTVGIAIITKISADLCRDAKETAIASGIEITGSIVGLYVALPLFRELLSLMTALV